jgi:hypothetical protein
LVNDQKSWRKICNFLSNGKQGPDALTNNKRENVDQIQADKVTKRNGVRINWKKYKNICFPKHEYLKNFKTCYDPYSSLDLSMHVNNTPNPSRDPIPLNYFGKRSSRVLYSI